MTDAEATRLGEKYTELEQERDKARNQSLMYTVGFCEDRMAAIESQFQRADLSLDDYRKRNDV
jgi:hypothetical protein